MLTKLTLRNFKRFKDAEVELGKSVVFIGPNNSGKTTALQGLALWEVGLRAWLEKRGEKASPTKRPGVPINRKDLTTIPVPTATLLWNDLHVRRGVKEKDKKLTKNIRIDVIVEGITEDKVWNCGFEFDFSNDESIICRPVRKPGFEHSKVEKAEFTEIPEIAGSTRIAFLPPMSGLADREFIKQPGEISYLIGQGQTAQVLRNICRQVHAENGGKKWDKVVAHIQRLFGVTLEAPKQVLDKSEIVMEYRDKGATLDLSSSGRGLQQTLLLLAYLYSNPRTALLLDEPDAHLEILRQRQIFQIINDVAETEGSQIIAASHSEVVLNEAAGKGHVVAFVGKPHLINNKTNQVLKSLTDIGWDLYYQAETAGWILFLEAASDLAILQNFARILGHPVAPFLDKPFVHYVSTNLPQKARDLFNGLLEAKTDLVGFALFDRLDKSLQRTQALVESMWSRREIENYFCVREVLLRWAEGIDDESFSLFSRMERPRRLRAMEDSISEISSALATLEKPDPWSSEIKATDDFLDPLFKAYFKKLELPLEFRKRDYHELVRFMNPSEIDAEVGEKLDAILDVATRARTTA